MVSRRQRPQDPWAGKGAIAGILGGIPMAVYLMAACASAGLGWLYFPNAVATNWVAYQPAGDAFVLGAFVTGMLEHALMSALWGIGLAAILSPLGRWLAPTATRAAAVGLVWGLLAFSTTWLLIGAGMSPATMWIPRGAAFAAHLLYGLTTAMVLRAWLVRPRLRVTFAPDARTRRDAAARQGDQAGESPRPR